MAEAAPSYKPLHPIRIVTATALFDGHDVAVNLVRRLLANAGVEVIHLGHSRSVAEIVACAIQEDAQGVVVTSYQGGHLEFFNFLMEELNSAGGSTIRVFAGGGGTIQPDEIALLKAQGILRVFTPEDGRRLGLQGMIDDMLRECDFIPSFSSLELVESPLRAGADALLARSITFLELNPGRPLPFKVRLKNGNQTPPVIGITGPGGAGKSCLIDTLVHRFLREVPDKRVAVLSVDPTRTRTGGALLGDRIRMNTVFDRRVFMRSQATREASRSLSRSTGRVIQLFQEAGFDLVIVETAGTGQSDSAIVDVAGCSVYVMTPEFGSPIQLEKIDMLDRADVVVLNKVDKPGARDACAAVRRHLKSSAAASGRASRSVPVFETMAAHLGDQGVHQLYRWLEERFFPAGAPAGSSKPAPSLETPGDQPLIPWVRNRYLDEIADALQRNHEFVARQSQIASRLYQLHGTLEQLSTAGGKESLAVRRVLETLYQEVESRLDPECRRIIQGHEARRNRYRRDIVSYCVRGREIEVPSYSLSLSGTRIAKVVIPAFRDWGDIVRWTLTENIPGEFPYTAGVFPFRRTEEESARMVAGEGAPERTNRRFHLLCRGLHAARLSTALDPLTLYGEDPAHRPDLFGRIGNSGVSVASLDDTKRLYSGFDLCAPSTSVSLTINGPAPMLLAFFLNAAIDQQCEAYLRSRGLHDDVRRKIEQLHSHYGLPAPRFRSPLPEGNDGLGLLLLGAPGDRFVPRESYEQIRAATLKRVRGTVQADILKEDQAQNECIFPINFALRMMGDIQEFFIRYHMSYFYSVSVSGYHIAEAGANPITQLAFALANGFTYLEYYLSRGMQIDEFAPSFSFFFSSGMDPEYAVLGRVARRIWARVLRDRYRANERSQKLKYHIQTSGRSLQSQEFELNDIRTTLQALTAFYDNCNSLHTNARDEAVTTPTEESVRRALAIQLIINQEFGLAKNENVLQGSFVIGELTDLVEEAVVAEFRRISERGGVLGAMESRYQRSRIQEESLHFESLKHSGRYPLIGVNTFLRESAPLDRSAAKVTRSTPEERNEQIRRLEIARQVYRQEARQALAMLKEGALEGRNTFDLVMEAARYCSLGQMTQALYEVGGRYRRNI